MFANIWLKTMRAITAQRFVGAYALERGVLFTEVIDGATSSHDPSIVFSPVCFLPVVLSYARVLAKHVWGDDSVALLEISSRLNPDSVLGIEQQCAALDSSVAGTLRALLLSRGFDLLVEQFSTLSSQGECQVALEKLESAFVSPVGRLCLIGERDLSIDVSDETASELVRNAPPLALPAGAKTNTRQE
mgnify:CR=1 FL=1